MDWPSRDKSPVNAVSQSIMRAGVTQLHTPKNTLRRHPSVNIISKPRYTSSTNDHPLIRKMIFSCLSIMIVKIRLLITIKHFKNGTCTSTWKWIFDKAYTNQYQLNNRCVGNRKGGCSGWKTVRWSTPPENQQGAAWKKNVTLSRTHHSCTSSYITLSVYCTCCNTVKEEIFVGNLIS